MFPIHHPDFITITCLNHYFLLSQETRKDVLIDSLRFLVRHQRIIVYCFVIMDNHFHMIWQICNGHNPGAVQRDFLKFTGQQILRLMDIDDDSMRRRLVVNKVDRKRQFWERDSLRIPLWSKAVFDQKLNYIHRNPVNAGLCTRPEDYKYSSARFYSTGKDDWGFLTHAGL